MNNRRLNKNMRLFYNNELLVKKSDPSGNHFYVIGFYFYFTE